MTTQISAAQAAANQNYAARRFLLKTGTPMRKHVATFGPFSPGQQAQMQLLNVGVLTSLDAVVTAQVTITTASTRSTYGALNFVKNINFQDYTTQSRVNMSHRALNLFNSARHSQPFSWGKVTNNVDSPAAAVIAGAPLNVIPTAVVAPASANFRVPVHIPVAYDPARDLRGAILAQTIRGNMYLYMTFATAAQIFGVTDDAVYTAGAGSVDNIYVSLYQNYIQPANMSINGQQANAIPLMDCQTVYELATQGLNTNGIAANAVSYLNFPNARQVLSAVLGYYNGSDIAGDALTFGTDLKSIEIWANANTALRQYDDITDLLDIQRTALGGDDYGPGYYYLDSRRVNINTTLYGQVQAQVTPSTVNAGAYLDFNTESFYLKGTSLPGVAVGGT